MTWEREAKGGPRHLSRDFGCGRIEHESLHGVVAVPQELIVVVPPGLHSEGAERETHHSLLLPFVCMGRNREAGEGSAGSGERISRFCRIWRND